jgi:IS5 family transposase
MDRNYLAHRHGDANNALLAAAGYNFRRILRWLRLLLRIILALVVSFAKISLGVKKPIFTDD